ncbi:hypothetical protein OMAG_000439 [Candidatus Omnitrophus magneticus]|uniref:Uncharacterized protein n=1 Tax=Candidatus Omnitrophus magneticus TaxID=1609969 RepID=A0A0F0CQY7_9BACT|nr:hypothetical protein OMAG_000439 [Candidatus Omnitrophus magneticus]
MFKKSNILLKVVTNLLISAFFLQSVILPEERQAYASNNVAQESYFNVKNIDIPFSQGELEYRYYEGTKKKTIIHIQDAHCDYGIQKNISEIIKHLSEEYGIKEVCLEGGKGKYDFSSLYRIKFKGIRERVADFLMEEGLVNGVENFAINNQGKINIFGIEDTAAYKNNLASYREFVKYKNGAEKFLEEAKIKIERLKAGLYSEGLKKLDSESNGYKEGRIAFDEYLRVLQKIVEKEKIDISGNMEFGRVLEMSGKEKQIDFKKAEGERKKLVEILGEKLSRNEVKRMVENIEKFSQEEMLGSKFYEYLLKMGEWCEVESREIPELARYYEYIKFYEGIKNKNLLNLA